jgi:lipopolysaccharide heptosyltransferase II
LKNPSDGVEDSADERILVVRFSSLGDILLTAPALRALHARFPHSQIDLLVASEFEAAARLIPGPDRVLTFDRRTGIAGLLKLRSALAGRYHLFVDLQNSSRSAFLRATTFPTVWVKARRYRVRRWLLIKFKRSFYKALRPVPLRYLDALDLVGVEDDGEGLNLQVTATMKEWARDFLAARCDLSKPLIVLCPGARHTTKRWPADRWVTLGGDLDLAGYAVLVMGASSEAELVREISSQIPGSVPVTDRSIPEAAAILSLAATVVSNDSGLMHLAGGVGAPVVAIFGPTVEEFGFYPFRSKHIVLAHSLYCRPCTAMGSARCPEGHFRCMLETAPAAVREAVHRLLPPERPSLP